MTVEQLVCITVGFVVQGATFVLGILVGISMRKDSHREVEREGAGGSEPVGRKLQPKLPQTFSVGASED
jgi:hypothetical protein